MRREAFRSLAAAAMLIGLISTGALQAQKVDLTGKWLFNVQTDAGSGTPTVTLKQDGEKLTGTIPASSGTST